MKTYKAFPAILLSSSLSACVTIFPELPELPELSDSKVMVASAVPDTQEPSTPADDRGNEQCTVELPKEMPSIVPADTYLVLKDGGMMDANCSGKQLLKTCTVILTRLRDLKLKKENQQEPP